MFFPHLEWGDLFNGGHALRPETKISPGCWGIDSAPKFLYYNVFFVIVYLMPPDWVQRPLYYFSFQGGGELCKIIPFTSSSFFVLPSYPNPNQQADFFLEMTFNLVLWGNVITCWLILVLWILRCLLMIKVGRFPSLGAMLLSCVPLGMKQCRTSLEMQRRVMVRRLAWVLMAWVSFLALLFTSRAMWPWKIPHLSKLQFPYMETAIIATHEVTVVINEIMHRGCLAWGLVHNRNSLNVNCCWMPFHCGGDYGGGLIPFPFWARSLAGHAAEKRLSQEPPKTVSVFGDTLNVRWET